MAEDVGEVAEHLDKGDKESSEPVECKENNDKTKLTVDYGYRVFREYCQQKGVDELDTLPTREIAELLQTFYEDARTRDGVPFSANSLVVIRYAINRYYRSPQVNRNIDIVRDPAFYHANKTFKAIVRRLHQEEKSRVPGQQRVRPNIYSADHKRLRQYFLMTINTPKGLLQKVWFDLSAHMGYRSLDKIQELSKDAFKIVPSWADKRRGIYQLMKSSDDEGASEPAPSGIPGKVAQKNSSRNRLKHRQHIKSNEDGTSVCIITERPGDPLCPVKNFEAYLSKLNPACRSLFQRPKDQITIHDFVWYFNAPLGKTLLSKMMATISKCAGLSRVYSNARTWAIASACSSLDRENAAAMLVRPGDPLSIQSKYMGLNPKDVKAISALALSIANSGTSTTWTQGAIPRADAVATAAAVGNGTVNTWLQNSLLQKILPVPPLAIPFQKVVIPQTTTSASAVKTNTVLNSSAVFPVALLSAGSLPNTVTISSVQSTTSTPTHSTTVATTANSQSRVENLNSSRNTCLNCGAAATVQVISQGKPSPYCTLTCYHAHVNKPASNFNSNNINNNSGSNYNNSSSAHPTSNSNHSETSVEIYCSNCKKPVPRDSTFQLKTEQHGKQEFCSTNCLSQWADSSRNSFENGQDDLDMDYGDEEELASPKPVCDFCQEQEPTNHHLVTADNRLRSFCSYDCLQNYQHICNNRGSPTIESTGAATEDPDKTPIISSVVSLASPSANGESSSENEVKSMNGNSSSPEPSPLEYTSALLKSARPAKGSRKNPAPQRLISHVNTPEFSPDTYDKAIGCHPVTVSIEVMCKPSLACAATQTETEIECDKPIESC